MLERLERRCIFNVELSGTLATSFATPYYCDDVNNGATISCTVKNSGDSNATFPVIVNFFLSKDRKLDVGTDPSVGSGLVQTLNKGKSTVISDDFTATATPGKYYLVANIDASGFYAGSSNPLAETNRDNNTIFSATPYINVVPTWGSNQLDGSAGKDVVTLQQNETHQIITVNGQVRATTIDSFGFYTFLLGASADRLTASANFSTAIHVSGGGGNDTIIGSNANDEISGSGGKDRLYGQGGSDYLIGGGANDYLEGGDGDDILSAGVGNDKLVGGAGKDTLLAGAGDDQLFAKGDGSNDSLSGGAGTDLGDYDSGDAKAGIEGLVA